MSIITEIHSSLVREALLQLSDALNAERVLIDAGPDAGAEPGGSAGVKPHASKAPCTTLLVPIHTGTVPLGHLVIEPRAGRTSWTAAEEASARALASALAGALLRDRDREHLQDTLHHLRAPLTAILAVSDIVRRYGSRLSDEDKLREMEKIQSQVRIMTRLLDETIQPG